MLISRGRIETRKCPRKYFWSYLYRGGSDSPSTNVDLFTGILTHLGMEVLFRDTDQNPFISALTEIQEAGRKAKEELLEEGHEPASLIVCQYEEAIRMAQAFVIHWFVDGHHEAFLKEFEIMGVESEYVTPLDGTLELFSKLDLAVKDKETGRVFVVNFKTTGDLYDWLGKWRYDIQMWTEALALEAHVKQTVAGCIVIGLKKGSRKEGFLTNPFIYGWKKVLPDGSASYSSGYKRGWEKFQVWEDPYLGETPSHRIENWIKNMDPENKTGFILVSQPILKNDTVVAGWIRGVVRWVNDAEHINAEASETDKLAFFDQRFSSANCKFCPFENACMGLTTVDELLKSGALVARKSPITDREKLLEGSTQ